MELPLPWENVASLRDRLGDWPLFELRFHTRQPWILRVFLAKHRGQL